MGFEIFVFRFVLNTFEKTVLPGYQNLNYLGGASEGEGIVGHAGDVDSF